jgi:hypothetical protein
MVVTGPVNKRVNTMTELTLEGVVRELENLPGVVKMPRADGRGVKYVTPTGVYLPEHELEMRKRHAAFQKMSPREKWVFAQDAIEKSRREQWDSIRRDCEPRLLSPLGKCEDASTCKQNWDLVEVDRRAMHTFLEYVSGALAWLCQAPHSPFRPMIDVGAPVQMVPYAVIWAAAMCDLVVAFPDDAAPGSATVH